MRKCIDLCIPIIREISWKWMSVIVNLRDSKLGK